MRHKFGALCFLFLTACSVSTPQVNRPTTVPTTSTFASSPALYTPPPPPTSTPFQISTPRPTATLVYSSLPPISVTNAPSLELLRGLSPAITSIAFSPNGNLIVASYDNGTILMWDIGQSDDLISSAGLQIVSGWGINRMVFEGNGEEVASVVFSPDGRILASAGTYAGLVLRDVQSGQVIYNLPARTSKIAFSPDGQTLAVSDWSDLPASITLWDVAQGQLLSKLAIPGGAESIAFSPDGARFATAISDEFITLWDVSKGYRALRTFNTLETTHPSHYRLVHVIAFSPDGKLLASGIDDFRVPLWEITTGKLLQVLDTRTEETIKDLQTGESRTVYSVPEPVESLAFSPDGNILAMAAWNEIILKRVSDGEFVQKIVIPDGSLVTSIAFSPDGRLLASGNLDGILRIWAVVLPQ